jgi:hypothetical protein
MTVSNEAPDAVWIDTCILVYANLALSPFHQLAVERLKFYMDYGVEHLLTHNIKDFTRFSNIIKILPLVDDQ